jgi:hypothetical protein
MKVESISSPQQSATGGTVLLTATLQLRGCKCAAQPTFCKTGLSHNLWELQRQLKSSS